MQTRARYLARTGTALTEAAGATPSVGHGCTVALAMTTCSASTARNRHELGSGESDLLVGGPGRDIIKLIDDQRTDVVRLRNGGADHVICSTSATDDVLFVDRTDRLSPSCENATVLFTERPRYPYP